MGNLYGIEVRLITAVCGILGTIGIIAVQFKVFGNVFNYFLGIDSIYALLLASTIVILYSTFGGIRAVTHTDVVQFCTFGFVIPLIGVIIYNHITSENNFSFNDVIRTANFNYKEVFNLGNPKFWEMIPLSCSSFWDMLPSSCSSCWDMLSLSCSSFWDMLHLSCSSFGTCYL